MTDTTKNTRNNAIIKTKAKAKRRHSEKTRWRPDYAQVTDAEIDRMCESDDEEVKPAVTSHDCLTHRGNGPSASALRGVVLPTRPAVIGPIGVLAASDDVQPKEQRATTQYGGEAKLVVLKVDSERLQRKQRQKEQEQKEQQEKKQKLANQPALPHPAPSSSDHPIFRREALICELDDPAANEARKIFDLIRDNIEYGRDVKYLINRLDHLFAPAKKRNAEERLRLAEELDRLSNDHAVLEQKMQLFNDVDEAADNMNIDA